MVAEVAEVAEAAVVSKAVVAAAVIAEAVVAGRRRSRWLPRRR